MRSSTSLIQTSGRAARNVHGKVIMYADVVTHSMSTAIEETRRRREIQQEYNQQNGITPQTILKPVDDTFLQMTQLDYSQVSNVAEEIEEYSSAEEIRAEMTKLETKMKAAAERFEFEKAAEYRDKIKRLKEIDLQLGFFSQRSDT